MCVCVCLFPFSSSWPIYLSFPFHREKLILSVTALSFNTIEVVAAIVVHRYISKNLEYYLEKDESDYMELGDDSSLESGNSDSKKAKKRSASLRRLLGKQKSLGPHLSPFPRCIELDEDEKFVCFWQ